MTENDGKTRDVPDCQRSAKGATVSRRRGADGLLPSKTIGVSPTPRSSRRGSSCSGLRDDLARGPLECRHGSERSETDGPLRPGRLEHALGTEEHAGKHAHGSQADTVDRRARQIPRSDLRGAVRSRRAWTPAQVGQVRRAPAELTMWPFLAFSAMIAIVLVSLDAWLGAPPMSRQQQLRYEELLRRQRSLKPLSRMNTHGNRQEAARLGKLASAELRRRVKQFFRRLMRK